MRIRSFVEADRSGVLELWHRADLVRPWNDPGADLDRSLAHGSSTVLVAEDHERVVGTVMAGYDGHRGWLNLLAVATDWRGRGVGAALVTTAEERLRAWGCPDVVGMGRRLVSDLPGLDQLHVMGDVWEHDEARRTDLGHLLEAGDHAALASRLGEFAVGHVAGPAVVVAVPPDPTRARTLPALLATAVARSAGLALEPGLLVRRGSTSPLRHAAPPDRPALALAARYEVTRPLDGDTVVLVDDVVLTGTTLSHVGRRLAEAGAGQVIGVVAGRTRRA